MILWYFGLLICFILHESADSNEFIQLKIVYKSGKLVQHMTGNIIVKSFVMINNSKLMFAKLCREVEWKGQRKYVKQNLS